MAYADDVAVVTDSLEALQNVVDRWQEGTTRNRIKINTRKTEVMALGRNNLTGGSILRG